MSKITGKEYPIKDILDGITMNAVGHLIKISASQHAPLTIL